MTIKANSIQKYKQKNIQFKRQKETVRVKKFECIRSILLTVRLSVDCQNISRFVLFYASILLFVD